mmetsp:Transcript_21328/g.59065  ORF Transcript_21328/g.59065 Transcript_21328/m.59065 type:complete len:227 (+) Transcript_21328:1963-2643(+)
MLEKGPRIAQTIVIVGFTCFDRGGIAAGTLSSLLHVVIVVVSSIWLGLFFLGTVGFLRIARRFSSLISVTARVGTIISVVIAAFLLLCFLPQEFAQHGIRHVSLRWVRGWWWCRCCCWSSSSSSSAVVITTVTTTTTTMMIEWFWQKLGVESTFGPTETSWGSLKDQTLWRVSKQTEKRDSRRRSVVHPSGKDQQWRHCIRVGRRRVGMSVWMKRRLVFQSAAAAD